MTGLDAAGSLWLYFALVAGIVLLPGMDMAYVMAASLADGRKAGAAAVAGIVAGGVIHVAMGALGIGWVMLSSPRVFNAVLLAGALYVGWMGGALLRGARALGAVGEAGSQPLSVTFRRAVATCLLNPKACVFMLAVFPQFLRVEAGTVASRSAVLALITAGTQVAVYGAVALGAAGLRGWLGRNAQAQVALGRSVGVLLLATAAWTAWRGWQGGP